MKQLLLAALLLIVAGCATAPKPAATIPAVRAPAIPELKKSDLKFDAYWRLELPDSRFDASGLLFDRGDLLVVSDEDPTLYRIRLGSEHKAVLEKTDIFTRDQLKPFLPEKHDRFDFEGLAEDERGRIYVCEEADRWILRFDPATKRVDRLAIDWSSVRQHFSTANRNSSFEGIAIGQGNLWVANERDRARIIEVDLASLKIVSDFVVNPSTFGLVLHYSDLAWHGGKLFVLARHHRLILQVDPVTRRVEAEYDYAKFEEAPEHAYLKEYPTGTMEGLAVDENYFWLVTDNNGLPRRQSDRDPRPTLFRCPRPKL